APSLRSSGLNVRAGTGHAPSRPTDDTVTIKSGRKSLLRFMQLEEPEIVGAYLRPTQGLDMTIHKGVAALVEVASRRKVGRVGIVGITERKVVYRIVAGFVTARQFPGIAFQDHISVDVANDVVGDSTDPLGPYGGPALREGQSVGSLLELG